MAPPAPETAFVEIVTPHSTSHNGNVQGFTRDDELATPPPFPKATWLVYTSCFLGMVLPLQYGWSTSQVNYYKFHKISDCDRRPVTPGTCIMFPGHTKLDWILVVNAWILGGMFGALLIGRVADIFGRKRALQYLCSCIIAGAILQASAFHLWQFIIGRFIAGLASGAVTGNLGSYINEVAPPYMRSPLGAGLQASITVGILLVATTFFYLDFEDGWRIIAAFPIVLAAIFLGLAPFVMVESPVWLLLNGRRQDAIDVITRLYGESQVATVLTWLEPKQKLIPAPGASNTDGAHKKHGQAVAYRDLFSPQLRTQFTIIIGVSIMQKLTGINTVFYYSSDTFAKAGLENPRVSAIIIDLVNMFPCLVSGVIARRLGNRPMFIGGLIGMLVTAIGMTIAMTYKIPQLTITCMALFVVSFAGSVGPLSYVYIADVFPDYGRATVSSIGIFVAWFSNLVVGVGYPYISSSLDNLAYVPFAVITAISVLFSLALLPETAGKTNAEIQDEFRARRELAHHPYPQRAGFVA